jgi:hypothetical protein
MTQLLFINLIIFENDIRRFLFILLIQNGKLKRS